MLKKIFIYCIGLIVINILCQNISASGLKVKEFGLKAGINLSNFSNSSDFNNMSFNSQTNKTLGIFFSVEFEKNVYSQTELFISEKGSDAIRDINDIKYSLLYIDSYHLIKIRFPINKKNNGNLLIGPYYSVLLHGEAKIEVDGLQQKVINIGSVLNRSDWGMIFGANFETKIKGKNIIFELRYQLGLLKIFNSSNITDLGIPQRRHITIKNRSITFLIGYKF